MICPAFRLNGKKLGFDDKRGLLFFNCLETIKTKLPAIFVLENVKGLLSNDGGKTFKTILNELNSLSEYDIYYKVLNTRHFGLPQNRERIFFVGLKKINQTGDFNFPQKLEMKNINDFVDDSDNNVNESKILPKVKHKLTIDSCFVDFAYHTSHNYKNSDKYMSCLMRGSYVWNSKKNRKASVKELLMLQGFPSDFKQVVSNTQMSNQIGNSMSVDVLVELFKEIFKVIKI